MKKWLPVMILGGVLLGASAYWYHSRSYTARQLVQMLPPDEATHVFIDAGLLRQAGVLDLIAGSPELEDADYKKFVEDTGFDYRQDLDGLAIAFRQGDVFYAAQGKFDWSKLSAYATAHGGSCDAFVCKTAGSEPGRDVSYYMPRANILALAVSRKFSAGDMVTSGTWKFPPEIGPVAVWVSAPPSAFADLSKLPDGTRSFFSPLQDATSSVFTLGVEPGSVGRYRLRLEATTRDEAAAGKLAGQYREVTDLLVKMLERDKMTPNPNDLSGILTSGKFEVKGKQVSGTWPIPQVFLESFAASLDVQGR